MESEVKSLEAYVMQYEVFLKEYIYSQEAQSYTTETCCMIPLTQGESLAIGFVIFMPPSRLKEGSVQGTKFP